jgi:hypothetical protein
MGFGPVFAHSQHLAHVVFPQFQIGGDHEATVVLDGLVIPRRGGKIAIEFTHGQLILHLVGVHHR